jgi:hypothetical protein
MIRKFSDEELSSRSPVWAALSNLFVDSDVYLLHAFIARELRQSAYTESELLEILRQEAGPTFFPNRLSIAGEWVGYDAAEARRLVVDYSRLPTPLKYLRRLISTGFVERVIADHWTAIMLRRAELEHGS